MADGWNGNRTGDEIRSVRVSEVRRCDVRERLLSHVMERMDESVACRAADAVKDMLTQGIDCVEAEDLLRPLFEGSDFWAAQLAQAAMGIPADEDWTLADLLARAESDVQAS